MHEAAIDVIGQVDSIVYHCAVELPPNGEEVILGCKVSHFVQNVSDETLTARPRALQLTALLGAI